MNPRVHYRYGSSTVASTLALPALAVASTGTPASFCVDRGQLVCPERTQWRHHWRDGEEVVLSLAQQGSDYWLRFPDLADFLLQANASRIFVAPDATADDNTLEHLLVDQVLPRCLAHRAHLMLHASCITINGCHALFLGPSGWGKSTLAGLLHQQGHTVHSDDCVQVIPDRGRYEALPTYHSLRLYADSLETLFPGAHDAAPMASYSEKLRVPLSRSGAAQGAVPVDALYVLGNPAEAGKTAQISPQRPSQTCQALIRHSFRLDLGDRDGNVAHFARCANMVKLVPAFRLDYPRDYTQSFALVEIIARHLSSQASTS